MKHLTHIVALTLATGTFSLRPNDVPVCDYYAQQVVGNNTAGSQKLLLTKIVNTFVVGNYTTPNIGVAVLGIGSAAVYNGTAVNLLPLFTGVYNSTNDEGDSGISKLFLDDGGPAPLLQTMPANTTSSVQYHLLTDIYQYFGTILKCSKQGGDEFPAYQGRTSMYEVHKFMNLDKYQMGFFIWQAATAAQSLGFERQDVVDFSNTLQKWFNFRCSPAATFPGIQAPAEFQSVCIAENCPIDPEGGNCDAYPDKGVALKPVNITALNESQATPSGSTTGSPSQSATQPATTGGAATLGGMVVGSFIVASVVAAIIAY